MNLKPCTAPWGVHVMRGLDIQLHLLFNKFIFGLKNGWVMMKQQVLVLSSRILALKERRKLGKSQCVEVENRGHRRREKEKERVCVYVSFME